MIFRNFMHAFRSRWTVPKRVSCTFQRLTTLHDLSTRIFVILIPIIHWTLNPLLARFSGSLTRLVCCDRSLASSFVAFSLRYFFWFCTLPWLSFWVISTFASNYIKWKLSNTGGINTCFDSHEHSYNGKHDQRITDRPFAIMHFRWFDH